MVSRFWVYIDAKIQGPVEIPSLRKVTGFNLLTQVCLEGEQSWRMADEVIEIKSYFLSPPRLNSFALDTGNAAPKLELFPAPLVEEIIMPEVSAKENKAGALLSGQAPMPIGKTALPTSKTEAAAPSGASALRAVCETCGYKNPRDVAVCMKCGETLKGSVPKEAALELPPKQTSVLPTPAPVAAPAPAPAPIAAAPEPDIKSNAMVEISMSKLLLGVAAAALVAGGSFFGYRSWKMKHMHKALPAAPVSVTAASRTSHTARRTAKRYAHRSYASRAAALPGVASRASRPEESDRPEERSEGAPYRVVSEATPLQKRYSAPMNSPYTVKRRANAELWTTQEGHAIQQVQRYRIYGGLRTIERNTEILMQILRDREYNTAFESGKRIYLYDDLDWSAVDKEGPVYEVRLTFSGGKDADGSPKKQLHFAFAADLERGTVEPGGQDQVRSNTLHAFFDESRIAPEDRRAIAKDTEELVLAAQPGASPLALDTVVRQFAKVYGTDALSRVADAYGLREIKKKLEHDPRIGSDDSAAPEVPAQTPKSALPGLADEPAKSAKPSESAQPTPFFAPAKGGGAVDFRMESGSGRERTFLLRSVSHASPERLWEVMTGYDRLKQFMPDMIASEREGQDGAATIVHTICLTRFLFFVFRVNLHLRVIEHPQQHSLEFERIAGEFESFRGSMDITTDPATHDSQIAFHATIVPSGHMLNWVMEGMARRLLTSQLDAIRLRAESK